MLKVNLHVVFTVDYRTQPSPFVEGRTDRGIFVTLGEYGRRHFCLCWQRGVPYPTRFPFMPRTWEGGIGAIHWTRSYTRKYNPWFFGRRSKADLAAWQAGDLPRSECKGSPQI